MIYFSGTFLLFYVYSLFSGGWQASDSIILVCWPLFLCFVGCLGWFFIFRLPRQIFKVISRVSIFLSDAGMKIVKLIWGREVSEHTISWINTGLKCSVVVAAVSLYCIYQDDVSDWWATRNDYSESNFHKWHYRADNRRIPLSFPYELSDAPNFDYFTGKGNSSEYDFVVNFKDFTDRGHGFYKEDSPLRIDHISSFVVISNVVYGIATDNGKRVFFEFDSKTRAFNKFKSEDELKSAIQKLRTTEKIYKETSHDWFERAWNDYWRGH